MKRGARGGGERERGGSTFDEVPREEPEDAAQQLDQLPPALSLAPAHAGWLTCSPARTWAYTCARPAQSEPAVPLLGKSLQSALNTQGGPSIWFSQTVLYPADLVKLFGPSGTVKPSA
ncbi:hypothetical protein AAFF_G00012490 [Aldrovandia affinis]|uniref:Uncharacterized protein n=1 Tax=Aldrovandia affinis TaxID=143900 RepID=A0AAD7WH62_9TELE|nr:hypothetical protein AAFF_G00012490 [Aldrovandia affinis]